MSVCTVNAARHFFLVYFIHVLTVSSKNQLFTPGPTNSALHPNGLPKGLQNHPTNTLVAVSAQLKSKVGLALTKAAALRITLNLDGAPIISRTHTHPSHSKTSRLLTSSLSLGVPVPRSTQCT
jgi:hypothetical protein